MTQSTDSITVSIRKPTEEVADKFSFDAGWCVQDYLDDFFDAWLHEYVYIVVDGQHTEDFSVVPQESLHIEFVPGDASFWIGLIISAIAGYVTYRYMKRKMQSDPAQAEEIEVLRSQRNRAKQYEPVPIVLGERRVVPQLAAVPFNEYRGRDQYLNLLLSVCHAPVSIKDIRLGDTSIYDLADRDRWITIPEKSFNARGQGLTQYIFIDSSNQITRGASFPDSEHIPLYIVEITHIGPRGVGEISYTDVRPTEPVGGKSIIEGFDFSYSSTSYTITSGKLELDEDGDELEIQVYDGYTNPNPITLFPNDVFEEDVDFEFKDPGSEVRTTAPGTTRIGVDYFFPLGVWRTKNDGSAGTSRLRFKVEYRETGTDNWQLLRQWGKARTDTEAFFVSFTQDVPPGQYDVKTTVLDRVDRLNHSNDFIWSSLKSFREGPAVVTDASALIAVRIKATERASGTLDRLNCVVSSLVPENWNTDWSLWRETVSSPESIEFADEQGVVSGNWLAWLRKMTENVVNNSGGMKESSNPAELFRWLLQGPFLSKRVGNDKIDLKGLEYFRDFANLLDFECNAEIESESVVSEVLNNIAATSFGELIVKQGKFSVAIDEPKDYYSAVYNFTNSNSISFEREFLEPIDGYRVEFDNKEMNYERDEIVVSLEDNNPVSGNLERVTLWGITGYNQAYRVARRLLAERTFRTEAWNFTANIESVDVTRGDVVLVQMPTVGIGVCSGRVSSVGPVYIDVSEDCPTESGKDYSIIIVYSDNTTQTYGVDFTDGNRVYINGEFSVSKGDRFHFGVTETISRECLVQEIKPNSDLSFDVVLVNYAADDVFGIDELDPPEYLPSPDIPNDQLPNVKLSYFRASRDRYQTEGGVWKTDVDVGYKVSDNFSLVQFDVELQYRREGTNSWTKVAPQSPQEGSFSVEGVRDGQYYDFRIRAVVASGEAGDWFQSTVKIKSRVEEDPKMARIAGLKLYGSTETEFYGRDVKLVWRKTSNSHSYELGDEPAGADDGGDDPYFESYEITVIDPESREILRVEQVKDTFYNYTYEKNLEDGGPRRELTFDAKIRGKNNQTGISSRITVENPVPEHPTGVQTYSGITLTTVNWNGVDEPDVAGYMIVASDESGFDTSTAEVVYLGTANSVDLSDIGTVEQGSGNPFYFRIATVDDFYNPDFPEELLFSEEYTVNTVQTAEYLLENLTDKITESQLYEDLNSRIDLIDDSETGLVTRTDVLETETSAQATDISQLTAAVDGNTAAIETKAEVTALQDVEDDGAPLTAQWTVKTDVNDLVGGIGLYNDGQQTMFAVNANRFYITDDGTVPFVVDNGRTVIKNALIADAAITRAKIGHAQVDTLRVADQAITASQAWENWRRKDVGDTYTDAVGPFTMTVPDNGVSPSHFCIFQYQFGFECEDDVEGFLGYRILVNGSQWNTAFVAPRGRGSVAGSFGIYVTAGSSVSLAIEARRQDKQAEVYMRTGIISVMQR